MENASNTYNRRTNRNRWIARGIGSLVAAFYLFICIFYALFDPPTWTLEEVIMTGLVTTSLLGVLIAWWREEIGGVILVTCGIAHSTFAFIVSGHNKGLAMLVSGGPFLLVGVLFLSSWQRVRRSR